MIKVFDSKTWFKKGDVENNECFWKEANILRLRFIDNEFLVDVQFINGQISNGHFLRCIKFNNN